MRQLGLQLLEALQGPLALCQIAHKAGEQTMPLATDFPHSEFDRKKRTVLALPGHNPANTDDPSLAGREVAGDVAVMGFAIGRRHQHADVAATNLVSGVTEHALGRGAEGLDDPVLTDDAMLVDDDHAVRNGIEDRAQMRFPLEERGLSPIRFSNVAGDLRGADDLPGLATDRRYGQRDLNEPSVLSPTFSLVMLDPLAASDAVEDTPHLIGASRGCQNRDRLSDHLGGGIAENPLCGLVPTGDDTIERLADDRVLG